MIWSDKQFEFKRNVTKNYIPLNTTLDNNVDRGNCENGAALFQIRLTTKVKCYKAP